MFTGLIAKLGTITAIERGESSAFFTINAPQLISEITLGDSVAVNGVCLTATSVSGNTFTADVMVQTLSLTSLSALTVGSPVNLELAARLNARLGGHIVQGHVDGVGSVSSIKPGEKWSEFSLTVPEHLLRYLVAQGSIALDGVSLTVGSIDDASCTVTVWLIPETLAKTNLSSRQLGDLINIEVDILAKYVERMVAKGLTRGE
ncbi:MAG: riboflavin synthase [Candidatus Planktophila sp.]|nr:riboflavin synthase [Candidatus Planktophila sp.]